MFMNFILSIFLFFPAIAFFTIMERKILGIFHMRLGPMKVGIMGILQPFSDAIKLFMKYFILLMKMNSIFWNLSPLLLFLVLIMILNFMPIKMENNKIKFNMLLLLMLISLSSLFIISGSFFSYSKFSIISSKRLISQIISYEMGLIMIFILLILMLNKINISLFLFFNKKINLKFLILLLIFILILSESSRMPFDFIEGESELISGFNTEYFSYYFSLFFIYEYGIMLFFSILISMMNNFMFSLILMFYFIKIRSSFPRFRYDQMMIFFWKYMYPLLISIMIFCF